MDKTRKKLGIGTFSISLIIFGFIFGYSRQGICLGDNILKNLGISSWSNGTTGIHYTTLYSMVFFIAAFVMALKGKNDYGARIGLFVSMAVVIFTIVSALYIL